MVRLHGRDWATSTEDAAQGQETGTRGTHWHLYPRWEGARHSSRKKERLASEQTEPERVPRFRSEGKGAHGIKSRGSIAVRRLSRFGPLVNERAILPGRVAKQSVEERAGCWEQRLEGGKQNRSQKRAAQLLKDSPESVDARFVAASSGALEFRRKTSDTSQVKQRHLEGLCSRECILRPVLSTFRLWKFYSEFTKVRSIFEK